MNSAEIDQLHELALLYRLETSFYDGLGTFCQSPPEAIVAILQSLGAPLQSLGDVPEALSHFRSSVERVIVEPVVVVWQTEPAHLDIRGNDQGPAKFCLELESGEERNFDLEPEQGAQEGHSRYALPPNLPLGYHLLQFEASRQQGSTLLVVSPRSAFSSPETGRQWGAFLPLYSLSSRRNWGAGNFTELGHLIRWVASLGGQFMGTLPLFSAFLKDPLDPSPYAPVSRLFWNEFFIDPMRTAEWNGCSSARELFSSAAFREELRRHREYPRVDYEGQMKLKRRILETLVRQFYNHGGTDLPAFQKFLEENPSVDDYASFRAVQEKRCEPWGVWPERLRDGVLRIDDYHSEAKNYHIYVQWIANQQMREILKLSQDESVGLYLDLPLGVHPDGFDVWMNQTLFASGVAGGAPPDSFFTNGQNWGFRPLHPERSRLQCHSYFREILCHLMTHSDLLRIDHVMSLHRLFWVPAGFSATDGVYVHYPWEELYAILTLESSRQNCVIVGEDLGTVPPSVRESMADHEIHRMYVTIFEASASTVPPVNEPPSSALAALNTHDTATFAAFWQGLDIEGRREMGLLSDQAYAEELSERSSVKNALLEYFSIGEEQDHPDTQFAVLRALISHLSSSAARYLLVNLEDLWLETASQNVPGTGLERPNWRNKTRIQFEQFSVAPEVLQFLAEVDSLRRRSDDDK